MDQIVIGNAVRGDVLYVRDVAGDVSIGGGGESRYRYWCEPFPKLAPLKPGQAAEQPRLVLDPGYQIAPLVGRDREVDDLQQWLHAADPVAVRLLHAEAGHGKTRLIEHIRHRAEQQGWLVQQAIHTVEAIDESATVELGTRQAILLVVDDAHRWPAMDLETVTVNLRALHKRRPELTVRLLLAARSPASWWPTFAARLRDLRVAESVAALAPLGFRFSRIAAFDSAITAFRVALYAPPPQVRHRDPAEYRANVDLSGAQFDSVLAIHMAALTAVHARANRHVLPTNPEAAALYLLDNEYAEWSRRHDTGELRTRPEVMCRLVYLASLTRGLPRQHARQLLIATRLATDEQHAELLLDDHARCYPNLGMSLAPLQPDQLAETFLALTTPGHPTSPPTYFADTWMTALPNDLAGPDDRARPWVTPILASLTETASRWSHLAAHVLYPLLARDPLLVADLDEAALTRLVQLPGLDPAILMVLHQNLSETGDPAASIVHAALLPHRIDAAATDSDRARLYTEYAHQLETSQRLPQACDASERAIVIYRRLADTQFETYIPILARSLHNLSVRLGRVGRWREALAVAEEAVGLLRQLAEAQPETHLPELASALNGLGNGLGRVGRGPEALAVFEEGAGLWRRLADAQPEIHLPDLALSLHNLAIQLGRVGQPQRALAVAEEAVSSRRRLAEAQPETHLPELARSLDNLAVRLMQVGRGPEALAVAEEGVGLWRRLADAQPETNLPELANCLNTLAGQLSEVRRPWEALAVVEEAVSLWWRLADAQPEIHLPDLAGVLNNLANVLGQVGRGPEALAVAEEAVSLWRRLAEARPETHLPDLARALNNLGNRLGEVRREREALAAAKEAVSLRRRLAEARPEMHLSALAYSLSNLGNRLGQVGEWSDALTVTEEGVDLWRRLAQAQPDAYLPDLAHSLHNLGFWLGEVGRFEESFTAVEEAVSLWRRLAGARPEMHLPDLAISLATFARVATQSGADHFAAGLAAGAEAIDLFEPMAEEVPAIYTRRLQNARDTHSRLLGLLSARRNAN